MKNENSSFVVFDNTHSGILFNDDTHAQYPIRYYNVINGVGIIPESGHSYYGYIYKGSIELYTTSRYSQYLSEGMYFSLSEVFELRNFTNELSKVIVIEVVNGAGNYGQDKFSAMYQIGGQIEDKGRLKYIDGCTDSLLIAPVKKGNPCLNHLHFPAQIDQTQHTHPSHRIGIVANGQGECITPFGNLPLEKGTIFIIKEWDNISYSIAPDGKRYPNGQHAFKTTDSVMNVIAFHPDSDFGATDEIHPMINRTIVNGVSASTLSEIRTK